VARVEWHGEQTSLLPLEMHFTLLVAGRPNLGRAHALDDVDQLFIEMIFRIERAGGRDLADIHAGETFHTFEIDIGAAAARTLPRPKRQLAHVLYAITVHDRNTFFFQPELIAGFAFRHG